MVLHRGAMAHGTIHLRVHAIAVILLHQLRALARLVEIGEVEVQAVAEGVDAHVEELLEVIMRRNRQCGVEIIPGGGGIHGVGGEPREALGGRLEIGTGDTAVCTGGFTRDPIDSNGVSGADRSTERTRYCTMPTQHRRSSSSERVAEEPSSSSMEKKKVEEVEEKSGGLRRGPRRSPSRAGDRASSRKQNRGGEFV